MSALLEVREASARYLIRLERSSIRGFDVLSTAPGAVAKLRRLILTLAVRGHLAPQDPDEEQISALAESICKERDHRDSGGDRELTKQSPRPIDGMMTFQLPPGWKLVQLGEAVEVLDSLRRPIAKGDRRPGPYLYYGASGVVDQVADFLFDEPLVLIGEDGAKWGCGDNTAFKISGKTWVNNHAHVVRPIRSALLDDYLVCTLNAMDLGPFITGMTVPKLNQARLTAIPLPLPPLEEQHRILARIQELMKLCDALEQSGRLADEQHARLTSTLFDALAASESAHALAENWQRIAEHFDLLLDRPQTVDALEQTILQLAVRGQLVPHLPGDESAEAMLRRFRSSGIDDHSSRRGRTQPLQALNTDEELPFDVPPLWAWARFASVAQVASDLVSPLQFQSARQVAPDCIEKATGRLIQSRSVRESGVISANHRFRAGQILYSKIRPSLSKVVIVDFDGLCSADMYPIETSMHTGYLHLFMLSGCFLNQVKVAENRVKMPKLNQEALNSFLVAVPPLAEQHRIVARVEELRGLCAQLRQRLTAARHTQSLLADALVAQASA